MTVRLALVLILIMATAASAATPIGPASWRNPDGSVSHAMGIGGAPALCDSINGQWFFIQDNWSRVGQAKIWRSVNGREAIFCDSVGGVHFKKGNHHLGLHKPRLIRFSLIDSTYQILDGTAVPDSVTAREHVVTLWGIFAGINLRIQNNPKVLRQSALRWEFTQAARTALAALPGTWNDRLVSVVYEVDHDSLNASLSDVGLSAGPITVGDGTAVWSIPPSFLEADTGLTEIPVYKRIARQGGKTYFFEGFSATATAQVIPGSLQHNATFGNTSVGIGNQAMNNIIIGAVFPSASAGTLDSITWCTAGTAGTPILTKVMIYARADTSLVACTDTFRVPASTPDGTWISRPVPGSVSISATNYFLCGQAAGSITMKYLGIVAEAQSDTVHLDANTFSNTSCVDPAVFTLRQVNRRLCIYATYTVTARNMGQVIQIHQ